MLNQHFLMLISDLCEPVGPPLSYSGALAYFSASK